MSKKKALIDGLIYEYSGYGEPYINVEPYGFFTTESIEHFMIDSERTGVDSDVIENFKPHYFPLPHLTQPIRVEGYNDNQEFVPIDWIDENSTQGDCFSAESIINDPRWVHSLPKYIHYYLVGMHFNTENLPTSDYIDASVSGVYSPEN